MGGSKEKVIAAVCEVFQRALLCMPARLPHGAPSGRERMPCVRPSDRRVPAVCCGKESDLPRARFRALPPASHEAVVAPQTSVRVPCVRFRPALQERSVKRRAPWISKRNCVGVCAPTIAAPHCEGSGGRRSNVTPPQKELVIF